MLLNFLKRSLNRGAPPGDGLRGALSGEFDIKNDTISGWVRRVPLVSNGNILVQAIRGHNVIADCVAQHPDERWRVGFTMPMDERFALAELARESIRITAVNERGDTGLLTLDGVTRLELIRRYMGVPVDPVFDIDLSRGGDAQPYLGTGWADPERSFRWMLDEDSFVHFKSPPTESEYFLRLKYSAFISDFTPIQPLDIYVNENLLASFTEQNYILSFREFRFSGECFSGVDNSTMRLHHPGAARPSDVKGVPDRRRLSLCLARLGLMRIKAEQG
jgi:hypothetical protein